MIFCGVDAYFPWGKGGPEKKKRKRKVVQKGVPENISSPLQVFVNGPLQNRIQCWKLIWNLKDYGVAGSTRFHPVSACDSSKLRPLGLPFLVEGWLFNSFPDNFPNASLEHDQSDVWWLDTSSLMLHTFLCRNCNVGVVFSLLKDFF